MKKIIIILLTALGLFVFQSQILAQTNNYTGTWILNLEKSQLESPPEGFTGSVFIIKQEGDKFKLTRYHLFGEKKKKISFKMIADGKTRKVKILFNGKLEWKENNLQATLSRKNFSNIVLYKFGNNQNEFIANEVFTGIPKNYHNVWVFNREKLK
jgi:hypothetical protein